MSNRVNLTLDVTKTGIQNPLIKVRQGDGGFETLRTTVTSNGEPIDLQDWTITFMGTTAGNHKIVDGNVTLVEAPNGIFDYTPSKVWGMDIGEFKIAYFKFVKGDGSASSANLRVNVIEAVDLTNEEAQNYISIVDTTIEEVRNHLESSLADVSVSLAATSMAASSMAIDVSTTASSAVDTINTTASSAVNQVNATASSAVNKVNSTASSAVSQANSAASNASSVASSAVVKVNDVASQVNSLSIGGRNYILNSSCLNASADKRPTLKGSYSDGNASISYLDTGIQVSNNQGNKEWFYGLAKAWTNISATPLVAGHMYTVSFKAKGTAKQVAVRFSTRSETKTSELLKFANINNDDWTKVIYTFVITSDTTSLFFRLNGAASDNYTTGFSGGETFIVKELKFEAGNTATDWSPAYEDTEYLDDMIKWETPIQMPITMTGPFASADSQGYVSYQGSTISFNFGGRIGSVASIGANDLVIGQLPSGVPLPISTIRGAIVNISTSKAPVGSIRINTDGSIAMNLGDIYTPTNTQEYWEAFAFGYTKAVFAPLSNASYQNIVEFSPLSATQGATFTKDYYFAMAVNSTEAGMVVYNRNTNKSKVITFGNGASNTGFMGHANDLAVLQDNSLSNGEILIGSSHMFDPGMPIVSYNPNNEVITKRGHVSFITDESTPRNLVITSILRADMNSSEIYVSSWGKYWKGSFDKNQLSTSQNVTVTAVGPDTLSEYEYEQLIGKSLASIVSGGQADWVENNKFYKVRTAAPSSTLSVITEFTMIDKNAASTGRYWLVNEPSWGNNEVEKVWIENKSLYVNVNKNTVDGSSNIIAKLADL